MPRNYPTYRQTGIEFNPKRSQMMFGKPARIKIDSVSPELIVVYHGADPLALCTIARRPDGWRLKACDSAARGQRKGHPSPRQAFEAYFGRGWWAKHFLVELPAKES